MSRGKTRLRCVLILILACTLAGPAELASQCAVTGQMTPTQIPSIMFTRITKTLSMAANCPVTMLMMNAFGCGELPSAAAATKLTAQNFNTVSPYCSWGCTCLVGGTMVTISITTADGLPVELMDFAVEG